MDKLNKELLEEAKKYDYSWKLVKALIALLPDSQQILDIYHQKQEKRVSLLTFLEY